MKPLLIELIHQWYYSCLVFYIEGQKLEHFLNFFIGRVKGLSFFLKNCTPTFLYRHPHNTNISMFRTIVYRIVSHVGMKNYESSFAAYTVSSRGVA